MARHQRRLAAIVSTDVVEYSRLMASDEGGTLAELKAHLRELVDPKIDEYGGRTVKSMGDGLLLEFPSVVDAVRFAVDVQQGMAERNVTVPEHARLTFRIGINVGDIIIDNDDIFGDGVNVAARLQTLAEPGGICVSRVVHDQVLDKLDFPFDDLGAHTLKNIARPVDVYRVVLGQSASAAGQPASPRQPSAQQPPSVAVLPFVNRGHDAEDEYFAEGLADELLNVLAKIRGLRVAARTSSFQFKGNNENVTVIGRKLNVATVLEGSVRKSGNRLRISVRLVNVADGYHVWSERYDRTLEDIFEVQDDIAQSVVKELRATLLGESGDAQAASAVMAQLAVAVKGRATDPEAHRLYLQARHFLERRGRDDIRKAIGYFKQALERDPAFARAWAALSRAYQAEADMGWSAAAEGHALGRDAAARALSLEPDLAEGHMQLGWTQMAYDWDWRGAEASFARAVALAPRDAVILRRAGELARCLGRLDEAIDLHRRAIELDPLSAITYCNLGRLLDANGEFDQAEQAFRTALELSPQMAATRACLALTLLEARRGDAALAEASGEPEEWARLWASAIIEHAVGDPGVGEAALRKLIAEEAELSAYQIAEVYATRGQIDLAFEWLERAYLQRDAGLSESKVNRLLHRLHADPRWNAFVRKMGLADEPASVEFSTRFIV